MIFYVGFWKTWQLASYIDVNEFRRRRKGFSLLNQENNTKRRRLLLVRIYQFAASFRESILDELCDVDEAARHHFEKRGYL